MFGRKKGSRDQARDNDQGRVARVEPRDDGDVALADAPAPLDALPIPPGVYGDQTAFEMMRIWGASGHQHVTIMPVPAGDPSIWGGFLVDLARHLAIAYNQQHGQPLDDTLARIKDAFEAEWDETGEWLQSGQPKRDN